LNKIIILISSFILFSCNQNEKSIVFKKKSIPIDSVLYYYRLSKDKSISLKQRKVAINVAYKTLLNNPEDTLLAKILYQKNILHFQNKDYDSLLFFHEKIKKLPAKNKYYLGKQYYLVAYYFNVVEKKIDSAFYNYNISRNYFQQIKDSSWVGITLVQMGTIQKEQADYFGSKETVTEALQYLNRKNDINYIASSYNTLAINHRKLFNYKDAIKYYIKAENITKSKVDKLAIQNNLATTFIDGKEYNKAIALLKNVIADSLTISNKKIYSRVLDNLAYTQWLNGRTTVEQDLKKALTIRVNNNDKRGLMASYSHLGEFYSRTNTSEASLYLDSVIKISKTLKNPKAEKDAIKQLILLAPKNIQLKDRYLFLQDSLYKRELQVKTQFAKYKYDDKLKQESILRLQKEKAEEKLKATEQKNQKILAISGLVVLFLITSFIVYFFIQRSKRLKQKNKTAKLEATYETEAELSRKLHDDFGGKLNHAMLLVQNNTDKGELLDSLETLYNQSRNFSRVINEVETGVNYKNELLQMLNNYTTKKNKLILIGSKEIEWNTINALTKTTLHKVLRELMINMAKHSQATIVTLSFKKMNNILQINYSDNGIGATENAVNTKNGLRNTEKRINAIGGTIIFETEKEKGFRAEIKTPN
jgi:tetratricopeptide (TPR) repeat protein